MADGVLKTETILDQLVAGKRERLQTHQAAEPLSQLERRMQSVPPALGFGAALRGPNVRLIAEIKQSSPTAGLLDDAFDPAGRSRLYAAGGAAAISVLTEERRFGGRLEDIATVRAALGTDWALPLLRKDFLFDPYQLYEARAGGADAVLLIVAVLEQAVLTDLLSLAGDLGLGALVEVHDEDEVERALAASAAIIGINNRDLRTFETSLEVTERLLPLLPPDPVVVSESGIRNSHDVDRLALLGVDAVLIGEALMRSTEIRDGTRAFTESVRSPRGAAAEMRVKRGTLGKIPR